MSNPRALAANADGTVLDQRPAGWLVVESGVARGQAYQVRGTVRIGRSEENDIVLADPQLSRQHAAISQEEFGYTLQDLNTTNGTFLNGERIINRRGLREGDQIRLGDTTLVFYWQVPAQSPQPPSTSHFPPATPRRTPVLTRPAARQPFPWWPFALGGGLLLLILVIVAAVLLLRGPDETDAAVVTVVVTGIPTATTVPIETPIPTDTPIPTETPIPEPVTVRVVPDGSGDYPSLEAAVDAVPPGSMIMLDPGTYRLVGSLEITRSLSLRGAGMDQTFVVGIQGEQVVHFAGPGSFAAEGITFRYEGTDWARVMTIDDGEIDIAACRLTGGIWSESEGQGGSGLLLWGNTTGTVRECRMEGNQLHGIEIQDQSQLTLEGNIATDNGQNGITYWDDAGGVARRNECSSNGYHGISVNEQAQPTLEENVCMRNEQVGIRYADTAGGVARGNECIENKLNGISVTGEAQPTLEENTCNRNQEGSGIAYFDQAGGAARRNKCNRNGSHGIVVDGEAQPTLEENTCWQNTEDGIVYFASGGGVALRNQCNGNVLHGIGINDQAHPTLEGNTCRNNTEVGIRFTDSSGGTARQNTCEGNKLHGIVVTDQAQPLLEGNVSINNKNAGIIYFGSAGGVAQGNTCTGNGWGIYIKGAANPDLKDNECYDNSIADTVLFADDFSDPSSGWWIRSDDHGEVRYENGELHILDYTVPESAYMSRPGRLFTDLILEVESRWVGGTDDNWHGLYCRYVDSDNLYVVAFSADGYYTGFAEVGGERSDWAKERSDAIQQGEGVTNVLRLECVGSSIRFYVNDTLLIDVTDTRLTEGDIGLDAESEDGDYTEVVYDNLRVLAP